MKSVKSIKNIFRVKNKLTLYFAEYKLHLIFCALFVVIGIALGVFTAVKYSSEIALSNLSDSNLVALLKGERGTMGLFFPYLFSFALFCFVIIFLNFKPILSVVTFFALLARGYLIAFDITILIILYGFSGIINVFIIILPCEIIIWLILIILASVSIRRGQLIRRFGNGLCSKHLGFNFNRFAWCIFAIGIVTILIKCLCLPLIRVTIIVN